VSRLISLINKQGQLQEVVACIDHVQPEQVQVHLLGWRTSAADLEALLAERYPALRRQIAPLDLGDPAALAAVFSQPAELFALPIYHASALYRRVPWLRRRSRVVHITDGLGDLFSMWELQRAVLAPPLLKSLLVLPMLALCRADLEFNPFFPSCSPYSRRSLPVAPFPMARAKRRLLTELIGAYRPRALVIDGFGVTAPTIAAGVGLASYAATQRQGGLMIDGFVHLRRHVVCTEELMQVFRPEVVVGCPSTALVAAKCVHPDVPVLCLAPPTAIRDRGPRFNQVFRKHASRFGVLFVDEDGLEPQLRAFAASLPSVVHACA
jgi:hypothetical protein